MFVCARCFNYSKCNSLRFPTSLLHLLVALHIVLYMHLFRTVVSFKILYSQLQEQGEKLSIKGLACEIMPSGHMVCVLTWCSV